MNSFVALMLTFRFSCNTYLSVCLCLSPKQNLCHPSYYVQSPSPRREHSIFTFLSLSLFQSSSIQRPAWAFQLLLVRRYFRSPHLCFHFCSFLFVGQKKVLEPKNNIFLFLNQWMKSHLWRHPMIMITRLTKCKWPRSIKNEMDATLHFSI